MILGLDVSTSITGVCVLDVDGSFISVHYIDMRKIKDFIEKCREFNKCLFEILHDIGPQVCPKHVFIEDKLSGFSAGKTMQQTLMKLASFNGVVTWMSYQLTGVKPQHIHPSTCKALMKREGLFIPKGGDKKRLTLDFVRKEIKDFPYVETKYGNPQAYCYDMADSYTVAKSGFIKFVKGDNKDAE